MNSIASESDSDQDQVQSQGQSEDTKNIKKNSSSIPPTLNIPHMLQSNGDDQINSRDSLKFQQESKRSSFLISNTRKLQILKQMHLMSNEELYEVCLSILQKSSAERNHFDIQILQKTFSSIQFFQKFEEQSGQSALLTLYKKLELETYDIHDLAIQQGTKGDKFYIILQGSVGVFIKPAAPIPPPVMQQPTVNNGSMVSTHLKSESNRGNNSIAINSPTQSQSTNVNQNIGSFHRNVVSPLQQSPVNSNKNNTSTQIINSSSKFDQASNRVRNNSSNDRNTNNPSLNIPTFSQITSDTVLQEQQGPSSLIMDRNSVYQQKQDGSMNQNQHQQLKQKSSLKSQSNANTKQVQISNTLNVQGNKNKVNKLNVSPPSSGQKSIPDIPLNQLDNFDDNTQTSNKQSNPKQALLNDQSITQEKVTNSGISNKLKSAQAFQDNQVFTFLNIISNKTAKERVIFPPHEQKNWQKVNQMVAGQSFGELALLNDAPRMANVVCNSVCHFAVLSKKDFREVVASVESQKIKGYIQFLQGVPGFDKISRRALNLIVYSFDIKTYTFRDVIFKEKQKADHLYIVKEGEFCLQQSVDFQPPKDPARYNYEEFNNKYKPANQNKAVRKAQLAVLSRGVLFGDYEVFAEIPRCMDAVCNSQKGEVFCISIQNLVNRCEILNDRELLANLKFNSQQKQGIHQKMLKYIHGTSSSFQNILVNNQKLIADQKNTDCINVNRSQSRSKKRLISATKQPQNLQIPNQTTTNNQQLKESLYEPAFVTQNLQNLPRGKSAPSSARNRTIIKTLQNNLMEEQTPQVQYKQENTQCETHRSSMNSTQYGYQRFSDQIQDLNSQGSERNQGFTSSFRQNTKKLDGNSYENDSQERMGYSRQVPRINMSFIKIQTPMNQNTSRPQSSERSSFAPSVTARSRYNNILNQGEPSFIQIQNQSVMNSPRKKQIEDESQIKDLSKSVSLNKQNQRQLFAKQPQKKTDKSYDNLANISQQESTSTSFTAGFTNNIPITAVVRKRLLQPKEDKQTFEKDLKSENLIKAKKMILNQLNSQAQKQNKIIHNNSVDVQNNSTLVQQQVQPETTNKAVDLSFKPNLAFSKLQINPHVDYNETRKQVLRKMRKFKQIDYLNEMKKTKQLDQDKLNNEYSKINHIKNKGYVVINPHAFINFVNIS